MYGDNFLVDTHQEVTTANQGSFFSQVVFPPEVLPNLPTKAVVGCGGGVSQEAEYQTKCIITAAITKSPAQKVNQNPDQ